MTQISVSAIQYRGANEQPVADDLLSQIAREKSFFLDRVSANEEAGRLLPEVFDRLLELGAIHAMVPTGLGGLSLNAVEELQLIEALAEIDPSTGWVTMATGFCSAAAAAYLPKSSAEEIFGSGTRGVVAGAGAPTGLARSTTGGFRVSGQWRYGSGILHANWAHCGTMVEVDGERLLDGAGNPVVRMCYIPIERVSLQGNWDVLGLRATGSVDFSVDDIFVPEQFTVHASAPGHRQGDAIFAQSFTLATFIGHSGWAAGAARRVLDELADFARSQGQRSSSVAFNHAFHEKFAQFEAKLRGARAFLFDVWKTVQTKSDAGVALDTAAMTMVRLALVHVTEVAAGIANFAYRIGGGETLRQGPLQRLCRDILAGAQHMTSSPPVMQACGRVLAGLAEGEIWATNSLVKAPKVG